MAACVAGMWYGTAPSPPVARSQPGLNPPFRHARHTGRPLYPYSIVPGGVGDRTELREAIERDPVVRAHYASFRAGRALPVTLAGDRKAHVSYRIGDRVYWTRRKVQLRQGEQVLTDGNAEIRARCGNRIAGALQPGDPTSPLEPSDEEMSVASVAAPGPAVGEPLSASVLLATTSDPILAPGGSSPGASPLENLLPVSPAESGAGVPFFPVFPPSGALASPAPGPSSVVPPAPLTPQGPPAPSPAGQAWTDRPVEVAGPAGFRAVVGAGRPEYSGATSTALPPDLWVYQVGPEKGPRIEPFIPRPQPLHDIPSRPGGGGSGRDTSDGSDRPGSNQDRGETEKKDSITPDATVPEPASMVFAGFGFTALAAFALYRQTRVN